MITETRTDLGPASVVAAEGGWILLRRGDREFRARLALGYPYAPEPGDVVLAIGTEQVYVIGVLAGRGTSRFHAPGDLEISADGAIRITAGREIRLRSPEVTTVASTIRRIADKLLERLVDCYVWVKDTVDLRAGRANTRVEGTQTVWAERIVHRAEKQVKIDGSSIHLG